MNIDASTNPRLQVLLDQANRAHRLRAELVERAEPTRELDVALESIFRDLGRAVWEASRLATAPSGGDLDDDSPSTDADNSGSWFTDEIRPETGPLFDAQDLDDDTDLPVSEHYDEDQSVDEDGDFEVWTIVHLRSRRHDPADPLASLGGDPPPPWADRLRELLGLLEMPTDTRDPAELAVESTRVQWASSELDARLAGLPDTVRVALIALLAARSQHVRQHLEVDVGPKVALERLRRYRVTEDLPAVHGLALDAQPVNDTWLEDARELWALVSR